MKSYKILQKKYPKILSKNLEMSCGLGWFDLLDALCFLIQNHVDNAPWVCADSKFKQWLKQKWNKYIWKYIFYPIGRKMVGLDMIPKSYLTTDPKYNEYKKIWDNWYKYQNKWCLKSKYVAPPCDPNRQVIAAQVKSKFASLRFYTYNADDYVNGLISMAESMSYRICENCGSNQEVSQNKNGWIETLCKSCRNKK